MGPDEVVVHEVQADRERQVSTFFEKALVSRVKPDIPIRIVKFCGST